MAKSIIQKEKKCFICGTTSNLEKHHMIHGWANRKLAEKRGLWCWLCTCHHTGGEASPHRNSEVDLYLKRIAQTAYEGEIGTRKQFIDEFGKSFL